MIQKFILSPNDDKIPVVVELDNQSGEYIITSISQNLTLDELITVTEEIKRIAKY